MPCRWYPSMPYRSPGGVYHSMPCRWYLSMSCRSLGGVYPSMPCRFPGPHPRGSLRGLARGFSRPTPGGSPDHTQRVSRPTPRGASRPTPGGSPGPHHGGFSRPTPRWCIPTCTEADPLTDGFCCRRCASYWNAFLFKYLSILLSHQHQFHLVHDPTKNSPKPFM